MIEINNLTSFPIKKSFFKKITQKILRKEKRNDWDLSVALVSINKIRELNKKYCGKNRPTDVLSFNHLEFKNKKTKTEKNIGEIIISPQEVKKNAIRFGTAFKEEMAQCLIHGILHLLGFEHENFLKEAKLMERKQNYYFSEIFIKK